MKRIHYAGIIIILLVLVGLFIISPFSPLNKTSLDGHSVKLPDGYNVKNSTGYSLNISNGTNNINMYTHDETDPEIAVNNYKNHHHKEFNITQKDIQINNEPVIKTTAHKNNNTKQIIYRYWFNKYGKVYDIQTYNQNSEDVVKSIISSF